MLSIHRLIVLAGLTAGLALAAPAPDDRLPDLVIVDRGELLLAAGDVSYRAWHYPQTPGKVHVVQYLAATRSASEINKPFTDRMKIELPQNGEFLSTTILNLDEAMWGTTALVIRELESNKQQFPRAVLVADADGVGLREWALEKDSSTVIVTDPQGVVRYFHQGPMPAAEIESTLSLIRSYIAGPDRAAAFPASG